MSREPTPTDIAPENLEHDETHCNHEFEPIFAQIQQITEKIENHASRDRLNTSTLDRALSQLTHALSELRLTDGGCKKSATDITLEIQSLTNNLLKVIENRTTITENYWNKTKSQLSNLTHAVSQCIYNNDASASVVGKALLPKRPLTPYFLFLTHARAIVVQDLGEGVDKDAVNTECQRRWAIMPPTEKQGWNDAYQHNLFIYNARVHAHKNGNADARIMTDQEALLYAKENGIIPPTLYNKLT